MIVIGITGTLGAGKGTIVDFLVHSCGFAHYSVRGYITDEIVKRGLPVNRDSMVVVANGLRANNSPSFIVDELFEQAIRSTQNCVIESIRTPGEIDSLKQKGNFLLIAVDADPEIRYQRIVQRNSETDSVSFTTFLANEQREMESTDPNKQNLRKCIDRADFLIMNNGTIPELEKEMAAFLAQQGITINE